MEMVYVNLFYLLKGDYKSTRAAIKHGIGVHEPQHLEKAGPTWSIDPGAGPGDFEGSGLGFRGLGL